MTNPKAANIANAVPMAIRVNNPGIIRAPQAIMTIEHPCGKGIYVRPGDPVMFMIPMTTDIAPNKMRARRSMDEFLRVVCVPRISMAVLTDGLISVGTVPVESCRRVGSRKDPVVRRPGLIEMTLICSM